MRCLICNKEIPDDTAFCPNCGAKNSNTVRPVSESDRLNILQDEEDNVFETIKINAEPEEQKTEEELAPVTDFSDDDLEEYPVLRGIAASDEIPVSDSKNENINLYDINKSKKHSLLKKILIPVTAVIIAAAVISGAYISSVLSGPFISVLKSGNKVIESESFNFVLKIETNNDKLEISGVIVFKPEDKILELLVESKLTNQSGRTGEISFVIKDRHLKFFENEKVVMNEDIGVWLDEMFETYEKNSIDKKAEEMDWTKIFDLIRLKNNNFDTVLFGQKVSELLKNLNNEKYIEENLGQLYSYEKENTTTYVYDINSEKLADTLINEFAIPLKINEPENKSVLLKDDLKKELGDNFRIKFGISDGCLSEVVFDCTNFLVTLKISEIGTADTQRINDAYIKGDTSGQRV